jgi:hypothetical protein
MNGVCMNLLASFQVYAPINLFMSPSFRRRLSRSFSLSANFILISMIIDSIYYKRSISIFAGQMYSESKFFLSLRSTYAQLFFQGTISFYESGILRTQNFHFFLDSCFYLSRKGIKCSLQFIRLLM